jgi:hypothetical protein
MLLYYSAIVKLVRNSFSLGKAQKLILKTDAMSHSTALKTAVMDVDLLMLTWY